MADRIVGPLTLVQFLYLLVGGIVMYFLFTVIAPVNLLAFVALALPLGIFTFAMTFLRIQDQPFPKFVSAFFVFMSRPKMRIWFKEGIDPELIIAPEKVVKTTAEPKKIKKSELDQLIHVLDTGGHVAPDTAHSTAAKQAAKVQAAPETAKAWNRPSLDTVKKKK